MKKLAIALVCVLCAVWAIASPAQTDTTSDDVRFIAQPMPEFPMSERNREGWIVLENTIDDDGIVVNLSIKDSSGSDAFNEAALSAVRDWRFESGQGRQLTVLLNFVFDRRQVHLSRQFFSKIQKVHKSIDKGRLDDALKRIDDIRGNNELTAYELAYSLIAEGRLASERGDKVEQLRLFRRAIINDGRWLERDKYLNMLRAIVILEIQQQELASALQHYEVLVETGLGRGKAADLAEPIQVVRELLGGGEFPPPYVVANITVTVEHDARIRDKDIGFRVDGIVEQEDESLERGVQ
ncbi:MAG: TonB family protein [Proteobacteria bacterium]|nr:TonB family protein [Pseudomonadota bacterium]